MKLIEYVKMTPDLRGTTPNFTKGPTPLSLHVLPHKVVRLDARLMRLRLQRRRNLQSTNTRWSLSHVYSNHKSDEDRETSEVGDLRGDYEVERRVEFGSGGVVLRAFLRGNVSLKGRQESTEGSRGKR